MSNMNDEELQKLFMWVDTIPLSRSKKNINRDFSDAVLAAEVIAHYFPRLVDMHNYPATSNSGQKLANWRALNVKVLKKLKYQQAPPMLEDLAHAKTGAVEVFLHALQYKLAKYKADKSGHTTSHTTEGEAQSVSIELLSIHGGRSPTAPALTGAGQACKSFAAIPVSSSSSPSPATSPARQHVLSEPSHSPSVFSSASLSLPGEAGAANSLISRGENSRKRHPRAEEQPSVDEEIMMEKEETLEELRQVRLFCFTPEYMFAVNPVFNVWVYGASSDAPS